MRCDAIFDTNFSTDPNISFFTQIIKIDINLIYYGKNQFSNVGNQCKNVEKQCKNLEDGFKKPREWIQKPREWI